MVTLVTETSAQDSPVETECISKHCVENCVHIGVLLWHRDVFMWSCVLSKVAAKLLQGASWIVESLPGRPGQNKWTLCWRQWM